MTDRVLLYKYLITLFLFDIAPGISFIAVAKNTIKSKSYKTGIFTALGVAISDLLSGILAFIGFGLILTLNKELFFYIRIISFVYIIYLAISLINTKSNIINNKEIQNIKYQKNQIITNINAIKTGFILTFLNTSVILSIGSIIFQFIKVEYSLYYKIFLVFCIGIISFLTFSLVALIFSIPILSKMFSKIKTSTMDRVAGIIILYLALTMFSDIMPQIATVNQ